MNELDRKIIADRWPDNPDPSKWPVDHAGRPMNPAKVVNRTLRDKAFREWIERIERMFRR